MNDATLFDRLLARGLAPRSAHLYLRTIRSVEAWCEAKGMTLRTVTASELVAYVETKPRSWATRKLLRCALAHYWTIRPRRESPLWAVRVPPKPRMRCRALSEGEASTLAAAARARRDDAGLVVLLALYLGLRREEIAGLRWDHFEADLGWVAITGKLGVTASLPVHPIVVDQLVDRDRNGPWVFRSPQRRLRHITTTTVWNWTRAVAAAAGVANVAPHRLRHTCLATANDATRDLRAVQEFARHARPETTAGYTRASTARLLAVMAAIDYGESA